MQLSSSFLLPPAECISLIQEYPLHHRRRRHNYLIATPAAIPRLDTLTIGGSPGFQIQFSQSGGSLLFLVYPFVDHLKKEAGSPHRPAL